MNAADMGPTALGRLANIPKQDVDRWARQERRLMPDMAARLAPHLSTTANRLLLLPDETAKPRTTTIVGRAGAATDGKVVFAEGHGGLGSVLIPEGASEDSKALEIEGYSMGVLADGALIFYTETHSAPTEDMLGIVVVIGTDDGSVLLKKLLRGSSPGLFDLESINGPTLRDQRVVWAAHIDSLVPPWRAKRLRIETFQDVQT